MHKPIKYISAGIKYLTNADYRFLIDSARGKYNSMPDEEYLHRRFKAVFGRELDLDNPITLNEKLQWLKLYNRRPEYTTYVDKYEVRAYIKKMIGEKYLIPLLGVWDKAEDIDFESLPNQFVLKCNHNSGLGMCICKDKSKLDIDKARYELNKGLQQNYFLYSREYPYRDVKRRIIAEKFMQDRDRGELTDYKLQCFNGKFDSVFLCEGRFTSRGVRYHYFDRNWNYLPYCPYPDLDVSELKKLRPQNYDEMISIAEKLAKGIPEVRIDLYEINGQVYFGEMTFFSQSGWDTDITYEADKIMGERIVLPKK